MSQKWQRSRKWDDEHLTGPLLLPVKILFRTLSSIATAVVLLSIVVVYAVFASVPIGLLAQIPTYVIYGITLLVSVALAGVVPATLLHVVLRRLGLASAPRFSIVLLGGIGLIVLSTLMWKTFFWPHLRYDSVTEGGLMLFPDFIQAYSATTLRRLPGFEMTELEFYAWWPLRIVLLAFVANMVFATVRRIEFTFVNIGVLTVHSGIVLIACGSIYYKALKQEGDTILFAGQPDQITGVPAIGPPEAGFYDNTRVALWVGQDHRGFEQRPLNGVPRYNDYNLNVVDGQTLAEIGSGRRAEPQASRGPIDVEVPAPGEDESRVDGDIDFRIVGYASYANLIEAWRQGDLSDRTVIRPGTMARTLQVVHLFSDLPDDDGVVADGPVFGFALFPDSSVGRYADAGPLLIEYRRGLDEERFAQLAQPIPEGVGHALSIEVPGQFSGVYPIDAGSVINVGGTGYRVSVRELTDESKLPIITRGYQGAKSTLAIMRIDEPGGESYDRWVYSRYPEISQDFLDEVNDRGMPVRRAADPGIRVTYIDATRWHVLLDERPDGTHRAVVRAAMSEPRVFNALSRDDQIRDVAPDIHVGLGPHWDHAERLAVPQIVEEKDRDREAVGTHVNALIGVEVTAPGRDGATWSKVVWVPFSRYLHASLGNQEMVRIVDLPDGREVTLAFGRLRRRFPNFMLQLGDFKMIAYDHRGAPRDYQSRVRVTSTDDSFQDYEHITKLNAPLQAPYMWSDDRSWFANLSGRVGSRLNPNQYKLSQAGWDRPGWTQKQQLADEGKIPRPYAEWTILGVGNNPGIHVVALGGILVGVGTPWAFYVKPWLVQRRKRRIQAQLAERAEHDDEADQVQGESESVGAAS